MSQVPLPQGVRHSSTKDEDTITWLNILVRPDTCGVVSMVVVTLPVLVTLIMFHKALADRFELTTTCIVITAIGLFVLSGWGPMFGVWLRYVSRETLTISTQRVCLKRRGPFISDTVDIEAASSLRSVLGSTRTNNALAFRSCSSHAATGFGANVSLSLCTGRAKPFCMTSCEESLKNEIGMLSFTRISTTRKRPPTRRSSHVGLWPSRLA